MQLNELKEVQAGLAQDDVALHAVTAEPGGQEKILQRLEERKVTGLPYPVHSDPEHKLLSDAAEDMYVIRDMEATKFGGDYADYRMVQPALVVVDQDAEVKQWWSWKTLGYDGGGMDKITNPDDPDGEPVMAVFLRPRSDDIAASIAEGRTVKLDNVKKG
eukprot:TRINITY_DN849_c0_g2_i2.p1 TRINITY_DN849_c0_g2~~TRINITY_DN849_c0_g2_i2.p1  ORF type:complete len:160 (+),score=63.87 TRINITY_DN849_c0_g2_i2:166-645(+)